MNSILARIGLRDAAERGAFVGVVFGLVFVLAFALWFGLQRADRKLGSNAVGVGAVIATPQAGDELCINHFYLPEGAERANLWLGAPQGPTGYEITLKSRDGRTVSSRAAGVGTAGPQFVELPARPWNDDETAALCITPEDAQLDVGGAAVMRLPGDRPTTLNGTSIGVNEPSVHFYSGADDRPVNVAKFVGVFANSRTFHGPIYPWVMLLTVLAALAASAVGLRTLVLAQRFSVKRIAVTFLIVSFSWCAAWSVMSPPFQGNDESEHFANLEYVAMTGKAHDPSVNNKRPAYSSHQLRTLEAYHHSSVVVEGAARPFWTPGRGERLGDALAGKSRSDGGGFTIAASGHSGLYYALFAPVYRATTWMQPANQLVVLRLFNSAAAATVALFAALIAALLLGDSRRHAVATAGALIAFQPMYAYVSGAINNDTFANVSCAAILWLLVSLARIGWDTRREIALGITAVLGPVGKLTAATAALFAAGSILLLMLRDRTARALRGGLTVLASVIATAAVWLGLTKLAGWPARLVNVHADTAPGPPEWIPTTLERFDYVVQQIFPFIEITQPMTQVTHPFGRVYFVGGFADFFWHRVALPIPYYKLIAAVIAVVVICGFIALVRHRRWVAKNWLPLAMVMAFPCAIYFMVHWQYATPGGRPVMAEQGRYIFPALAALAVGAAGAGFGLPQKLRTHAWGALVGMFCAFGVFMYCFGAFHVYA